MLKGQLRTLGIKHGIYRLVVESNFTTLFEHFYIYITKKGKCQNRRQTAFSIVWATGVCVPVAPYNAESSLRVT